jgi:ankyrin repeat protein
MIYESDRNMPLQRIRESYPWAKELPFQEKARIAIRQGDARLLAEALLDGAEMNRAERPLLVQAVSYGHREIALYLMAKGALVGLATPYGETALHAAAQIGHERLIEDLLADGAIVNAADLTGTTPLMLAAFHGHMEATALLVEASADLEARDQEGAGVLAHVRNGRAALEWKRRRSLREMRDQVAMGRASFSDLDDLILQDFEWMRSMDQKYGEIRAYLVSMGATDCGTPVDWLTIPKKRRPIFAA